MFKTPCISNPKQLGLHPRVALGIFSSRYKTSLEVENLTNFHFSLKQTTYHMFQYVNIIEALITLRFKT